MTTSCHHLMCQSLCDIQTWMMITVVLKLCCIQTWMMLMVVFKLCYIQTWMMRMVVFNLCYIQTWMMTMMVPNHGMTWKYPGKFLFHILVTRKFLQATQVFSSSFPCCFYTCFSHVARWCSLFSCFFACQCCKLLFIFGRDSKRFWFRGTYFATPDVISGS